MSPRITIRIDDVTKKKMDRVDENWSQIAREAIQERLAENRRRQIQQLISEYNNSNNRIKKLQLLHMYSYGTNKQYIYETAELVAGKPIDELVDEVENDLEDRGLKQMYKQIEGTETKIGVEIREQLAERTNNALSDELKATLDDAPSKIHDGLHILIHYVRDNLDNEQSVSINPNGFERTWKLYTSSEVDIDALVEYGIVYKDFYSSNAYGHSSYKVPDFTLELLREILEGTTTIQNYNPSNSTIQKTLSKKQTKVFLKWFNGRQRYVSTRNEDEEIRRDLESKKISDEIDISELRRELIQNDILYIDYSPHRSNTGNRNSRPAQWIYRLTDEALEALPEVLLQESDV